MQAADSSNLLTAVQRRLARNIPGIDGRIIELWGHLTALLHVKAAGVLEAP